MPDAILTNPVDIILSVFTEVAQVSVPFDEVKTIISPIKSIIEDELSTKLLLDFQQSITDSSPDHFIGTINGTNSYTFLQNDETTNWSLCNNTVYTFNGTANPHIRYSHPKLHFTNNNVQRFTLCTKFKLNATDSSQLPDLTEIFGYTPRRFTDLYGIMLRVQHYYYYNTYIHETCGIKTNDGTFLGIHQPFTGTGTSSNIFSLNEEIEIDMTWDGSTLTIYKNNVEFYKHIGTPVNIQYYPWQTDQTYPVTGIIKGCIYYVYFEHKYRDFNSFMDIKYNLPYIDGRTYHTLGVRAISPKCNDSTAATVDISLDILTEFTNISMELLNEAVTVASPVNFYTNFKDMQAVDMSHNHQNFIYYHGGSNPVSYLSYVEDSADDASTNYNLSHTGYPNNGYFRMAHPGFGTPNFKITQSTFTFIIKFKIPINDANTLKDTTIVFKGDNSEDNYIWWDANSYRGIVIRNRQSTATSDYREHVGVGTNYGFRGLYKAHSGEVPEDFSYFPAGKWITFTFVCDGTKILIYSDDDVIYQSENKPDFSASAYYNLYVFPGSGHTLVNYVFFSDYAYKEDVLYSLRNDSIFRDTFSRQETAIYYDDTTKLQGIIGYNIFAPLDLTCTITGFWYHIKADLEIKSTAFSINVCIENTPVYSSLEITPIITDMFCISPDIFIDCNLDIFEANVVPLHFTMNGILYPGRLLYTDNIFNTIIEHQHIYPSENNTLSLYYMDCILNFDILDGLSYTQGITMSSYLIVVEDVSIFCNLIDTMTIKAFVPLPLNVKNDIVLSIQSTCISSAIYEEIIIDIPYDIYGESSISNDMTANLSFNIDSNIEIVIIHNIYASKLPIKFNLIASSYITNSTDTIIDVPIVLSMSSSSYLNTVFKPNRRQKNFLKMEVYGVLL